MGKRKGSGRKSGGRGRGRKPAAAANSNGAAEPAVEAPIESQGYTGDVETLVTQRELVCELPGSRWLELGAEAAAEASAVSDIKSKVKALNKQKAPHEERLAVILAMFKAGGDKRMVDVQIEKDFSQNRIRATRVDSGELVFDWRAMTADERSHQKVLWMDVVDGIAAGNGAAAPEQESPEDDAEADMDVEDGMPIEVAGPDGNGLHTNA